MRVVVLALALALVAGHQNLAPNFAPGKTYVYNYEAKILGGLPEEDLAKAGLKLSSQVKISVVQERLLQLKLENPEIFEYSDVWPKDTFSRTELREDLKAHLKTPIQFKYEHGIVREILAPESVPTQVLNIHRGLLNVFQLSIKQSQNVYELQEEGAQGVCKTQYAITEEEAERYRLTKSRDLNHCQEKVIRDIGLAYTKTCLKCQEISKSMRGTTGYIYKLKKVPEGILVEEASGHEIIQFTPFNELNGAANMNTTQHLRLVQVEAVPIAPINAQYHHRGSLKYEFSKELLQTPIRLMKMADVKEQIASILTHLVENNRQRVHEDAPLKFLELIHLLRATDIEQLRHLLKINSKSHPNERRWLMDALPNVGTKDALEIVIEKIVKKDDVSVPEAFQLLIGSLHMLEPTSDNIEKVWNLIKEPSLQENYGPVLRKALLLGYGSLIHRHCAVKAQCHDLDIKRIQELLENAHSARNTEELVLLAKVMSNAAHPWGFKPITKLLPIHGTDGAKLPRRVHIEAILALRGLAKLKHKEVQNLALQLYMDRTLEPELRILSVMVLFETRPSMAVVTNVVNVVKSDRNLHVASFTYSLIKSLARSIGSVHSSVVAECNVALRLLGQKRMSMRFSKAVHLDYYNHPLMLGAAASVYYINDAASILPKAIVAKTSAYFAGAAADAFEIGVRSEGFQEYFQKKVNSDVSDSTTKMRRILNALSNWKSLPVSQMLGSVYVKVLGQEIAFVDIDKNTIEEAIKLSSEIDIKQHGRTLQELLQNGISSRFIKAMLATEIRRIMPTAAGLPMELALYTAAVTSADVHARINSNLPQNFHISHILKAKADIQSEIRPSIVLNTFAVMGVNTDIAQVAMVARANVKVNVPAKMSASLDFAEGSFKISALPVSLPENVAVAVDVTTHAVALKTARKTPLIPDNISDIKSNPSSAAATSREMLDNMPVQDRLDSKLRISRSDQKFCTDVAGLRSCLRIASHNARFISDSALYRLAGKHLIHLSFKQSESEVVEKWEVLLLLGPEGSKQLVKLNVLNLLEILEGTPALSMIKRLVSSNLRNSSSTSSLSSSSSQSNTGTSSGSSSSSESRHVTRKIISTMGIIIGADPERSSSRSLNPIKSTASSMKSQHKDVRAKFVPTHQKKAIKRHSGSASSGQSLEDIKGEKKLLRDTLPTVFVLILRAVKADNKPLGYEIAGYMDRDHNRVQVIMAAQAPEDNWRLVADAIELSKHKVAAKISWGDKALKYDTTITAETGLVKEKMAARVRVAWKRLPSSVVKNVKMIYKQLLVPFLPSAHLQKSSKDTKHISFTVVVESEKRLNLILKAPRSIYIRSVQLQMTLPINALKEIMPFEDTLDNAHYLLAKASSTVCKFEQEHITTFNNRRYKNFMPKSCYQVLVQECSDRPEFLVLLKKESEHSYAISVKIGTDDIDLFIKEGRKAVKVNEEEVAIANLPYVKDSVKIELKGDKLVLYAPRSGISELYFNNQEVTVHVAGRMKNKVCGLCGQGNGDDQSDYRTPNGRVIDSPVSFAHSWTLPSVSCSDESGCRMKQEPVELERDITVHGVLSRCHSVSPVMRCLPGCVATKISRADVGFHCRPINTSHGDSSEHSVDLTEEVESHLDCSCSSQCQ